MLTPLGRFLRILRIDRGEILKDMSEKLDVTVSFLSAVENGKKRMPSSWNTQLCSLYGFDERQTEEFTKAVAETERKMEIDFENASSDQRMLAVSFARKFTDFDERQIKKIRALLKESEDE